jgi:hypothetical protein
MAHGRQQIREALATALTGLTTTGSRVYQERTRELRDADLPALVITTDEEAVRVEMVSFPPLQERDLAIRVAAVAKATGSLDDTLDTICAEVETALYASVSANTLTSRVKLMTLEAINVELDDTLDRPVGRATMSWRCTYHTTAGTPATLL